MTRISWAFRSSSRCLGVRYRPGRCKTRCGVPMSWIRGSHALMKVLRPWRLGIGSVAIAIFAGESARATMRRRRASYQPGTRARVHRPWKAGERAEGPCHGCMAPASPVSGARTWADRSTHAPPRAAQSESRAAGSSIGARPSAAGCTRRLGAQSALRAALP